MQTCHCIDSSATVYDPGAKTKLTATSSCSFTSTLYSTSSSIQQLSQPAYKKGTDADADADADAGTGTGTGTDTDTDPDHDRNVTDTHARKIAHNGKQDPRRNVFSPTPLCPPLHLLLEECVHLILPLFRLADAK